AVKRSGGRLWLGLATIEGSIRPNARLGGGWRMVARSAYTQLRHSPWLLLGTLPGLAPLPLVPPLPPPALPPPRRGAAAARAHAAVAPTPALYGRSLAWAPALPLAGALYGAMTFDSARRHWRHEGARWKGRPGAGAG